MSDILEQYKYNSANELWKGSQLTVVSAIKGKAEHNIIFTEKRLPKYWKIRRSSLVTGRLIRFKKS